MIVFIGIFITLLASFLIFKKRFIALFFAKTKKKYYSIDDLYNAQKREKEKEIDFLLAKMGKNGIHDLSKKDQNRLRELSKI